MSHVSELDHRRLDATVYPDCVVEVHRISDISRGLRKVPITKIWLTERVLGRGTFGEVHLQSQDRQPDNKRAVKVISTQGRMSDVECKRELTALLEFTKPKYKDEEVFVHFLGWFQNDSAMYIAMEYMPLGDLENNLQQLERSEHSDCVLSEQEIKDIVTHILEGVKIMHAEGFAHRDLKPQNVLVVQRKPKWWVKLGDFGLSKQSTEASALRSHAGTQSYMAPEMFHYVPGLNPESSEYTSAVDIWAVGCIMYRILTRKPPFPNLWSLQRHCSSPESLVSPTKSLMAASMKRAEVFVRLLLMPHPETRPSAASALKHPWFKSSDQQYVAAETEVNHQSIHDGRIIQPAEYSSLNPGTIPTATVNSGTHFAYNTASHAGLHSKHTADAKQSTMVKPAEWPMADVQRMPEPMPHAFNIEKFDSLGRSGDVKSAVREQHSLRRKKSEDEESAGSSEDIKSPVRVEPEFGTKESEVEVGRSPIIYFSDEEWNAVKAAKRGNGDASYSMRRQQSFQKNDSNERGPTSQPHHSALAPRVAARVGSKPESSLFKKIKHTIFGLSSPVEPSTEDRPERFTYTVDPSRASTVMDTSNDHELVVDERMRRLAQIWAAHRKGQTAEQLFVVYFTTFSRNRFTMLLHPRDSVRGLKNMLCMDKSLPTYGLPAEGFRLNYNYELLKDKDYIKDYGIEEGSLIDLRWTNSE